MACAEPRLDHFSDLLVGEFLVLVFVIENPAFALGDNLLAEFGDCKVVSPIAERAFREFLDVAFVDEGDDRAMIFNGVLDRTPDEALRSGGRHGLDADAGIFPDFLRGTFQHFVVQKINQLLYFRRAGTPLDSRVDVFCVLAEDDYVHALRIRDG